MEIKTIDKQFYRMLGDQLNERRRELGLTLTNVAQRVGVSRQMYDRYEIGLAKIPADKWEKICEALDIYSGIDVQVRIGL